MARNRINVKWQRPPVELGRATVRYAGDVRAQVLELAQSIAADAEQEMKRDAPWTNRTGDARRGLFATAEQINQDMIKLYLSHGPDIYYGVFLELKNAGRYAIVGPTWERYIEIVRRELQRRLG
jgi:hypothetical protein